MKILKRIAAFFLEGINEQFERFDGWLRTAKMRRCYISGEKCEYAGQDDGTGANECLAIYEEQCPIAQQTDAELKQKAEKWRQKNGRGQ